MQKQEIQVSISKSLDWKYEKIPISQMRADLDAIEKLGATHVEIDCGGNDDSCYTDINAIQIRLETDEEMGKRIDTEKAFEARKRAQELQQLEMLKRKYEK